MWELCVHKVNRTEKNLGGATMDREIDTNKRVPTTSLGARCTLFVMSSHSYD